MKQNIKKVVCTQGEMIQRISWQMAVHEMLSLRTVEIWRSLFMNKRNKFLGLAVVFMVSMSLLMSGFHTLAAWLGWDLVDSGKHLDWDSDTAYLSSVQSATNTWNNYKSGVIRPDSILVVQDVFVTDYTEVSSNLGYTDKNNAMICFNTYQFTGMTSAQRQKTATHEFGHALGLDHTTGTDDVMRQGLSSTIALSSTDKASYDYAYNQY
ncbi:MAG: matrixin family metalloprotease [Clostridium sp.]|jgi:hypothetical protein|nr:matrixin family metalloprotease [Clostridium sp.]